MKWVKWAGGCLLPVLNHYTNWFSLGWSYEVKLQIPIAGKWCTWEQLSLAELPVHNRVLLGLCFGSLSPHFEAGKRERESYRPQISDEWLNFQIWAFSSRGFVRVSFHIKEQKYWSCFCENEHGRQRIGSLQPAFPPFLSLLVHQTWPGIFLTACGTQPRNTKSSAFSADSIFPHHGNVIYKNSFSKGHKPDLLGNKKQDFFFLPSAKMLCHSLSISVRGLFAQ